MLRYAISSVAQWPSYGATGNPATRGKPQRPAPVPAAAAAAEAAPAAAAEAGAAVRVGLGTGKAAVGPHRCCSRRHRWPFQSK
jgi:hypothetical protein